MTGSEDKTARLWDLRAKDPAANPIVLRNSRQNSILNRPLLSVISCSTARCDFYQVTRCDFRDSVQFPTVLPHSRIGLTRLWRRQATLARHITDRGAR